MRRVAVPVLLAGLCVPRAVWSQPPDFRTFRATVEPILLQPRPGNSVGPGGSCFVCHTRVTSRLKLQPLAPGATGWTEEQSRKNYAAVLRLVVPGDPLKSRLLLHPLSADVGGDPSHAGGKHWTSQEAGEFQTIAAWVRTGSATPAPPPVQLDYEGFKTKIQPILLKKRPGAARCVTCHARANSFLQVLAPASAAWTEEQSRQNFDAITARTLVVPGNPRSSRLLMMPLAQEAGGDPFHPGGKHWESPKESRVADDGGVGPGAKPAAPLKETSRAAWAFSNTPFALVIGVIELRKPGVTRREFLESAAAVGALGLATEGLAAQGPGDRPRQATEVTVLNPGTRVPVGLIIDDSTCLVNLNRFAMPQFDETFGGRNKVFVRDWKSWPVEIPDSFVRKFGTWCAEHGVKGKYSIVPYPACVGRLDRGLPGWTRRELEDSLALVRTLMVPNWDIHPEMVTHTRVIDLTTGHPYPDQSVNFMENWEWTTGRSVDELAAYLAYALRILKEVGLPCEGITTPGGFGAKVLPQLAVATGQAVRDVFKAEIPHYFRHAIIRGPESVAPRVENASGLDGPNPQCVVSIVACTNDWTGGWDNTPPGGPNPFITPDLKSGRMVEVIERGEPAVIMSHWTGIHWNGQELGFQVFQEVVRRLHARFDHLVWMTLSEMSRYWAAKALTRIEWQDGRVAFRAPFACPRFTVRMPPGAAAGPPRVRAANGERAPLKEVQRAIDLSSGTWCATPAGRVVCFDLPRGASEMDV